MDANHKVKHNTEISNRIRLLRKLRGLTLKALNAASGLSVSFLCDIEKGRSMPSYDHLIRLTQALSTSISYLLGETEYPDALSSDLIKIVGQLNASSSGKQLFGLLADFDHWSSGDQQELIAYLKAKQTARSTENTEVRVNLSNSGKEKDDNSQPVRTEKASG